MFYEKDLDIVLHEIMTRWDIPGMAVGIVEGGEIVHARGFGVQNLETRAPMTRDSVFCVQSISKCFVATAIMQSVEHGRLDLDVPLVQYLPYFQMDDERHRQITIRQALSHTSGMPDMDEREYVELVTHPEFDEGSGERYVHSLRDKRLISSPGERFSYSNIAYNVLGDLLAKVSAKSFESTMQGEILVPSGMSNSTFMLTDIPAHLLAWPHLRSPEMWTNPIYPYHRADAPASFLHTTVVDMCHWCITCLHHGNDGGQGILSPAGYQLMWRPVARRGNPPSMYEEMGLGWNLGHFKNVKTVSHGGGGFGWTAFLLLLPEKDRAACVFCNEESHAHFRVVQAVADALLGHQPQVNTVSWMVPISRALAEGGIGAAYARYSGIKAREDEFYFDEDDLPSLALQLFTAGKIDLAIEVLGLNIHVYPEHIQSYLEQARLYQTKGDIVQARKCLLIVQSIEPGNTSAARLLELDQ